MLMVMMLRRIELDGCFEDKDGCRNIGAAAALLDDYNEALKGL
jgi:hypothetical protein